MPRGARNAAGTVQDYASSIGSQVAESAERGRQQAGRAARQIKETTASFVNEQPLLRAAMGVAIGAAIAAMIPPTRTENELMGEASDAIKNAMGDAAAEHFETAKGVAGKVVQQAKSVAEQEGLTPGGIAGAARELADKVTRVATETASTGMAQAKQAIGPDEQKLAAVPDKQG